MAIINNGRVPWSRIGTRSCSFWLSNCVTLYRESIGMWGGGFIRWDRLQCSFWHGYHQAIFINLYSVSNGCSVLSVLKQFLSNWSQYLLVDGYRSDLVITWCIREVFWSCCCSSCTPRSFYTIQTKLYGWPDNFTLVAGVPSPLDRVAVADSPNRYRNRVGEWCMWALGNKIPKESFRNLKMSWRVLISLSWWILSGFNLPVLEYCAVVWFSAADIHLRS